MNKISIFKQQPYAQIEQKSPEWLKLRNNYITASSVYKLFEKNNDYKQYIKEKVSGISSFKGNDATCFGEIFEPVAREIYSCLTGEHVEEFGLITNPDLPYCAVSPDGVTESDRLLEIKCPYSRVITGQVPHHYFHQIQLQLAVCDCDECDFLECKFNEITQQSYEKKLRMLQKGMSNFHCICRVHNFKIDCTINGIPNTVKNISKFSRYSNNPVNKTLEITDVPKNDYWKKTIKPRYYNMSLLSLQTVDRNPNWVKLHSKELNETIPFIDECRKNLELVKTLDIVECEF